MKRTRFTIRSLVATVAVAALAGCGSSTLTAVPPPATGQLSNLARIVVTRPGFEIGGMIDFVVLDTGTVVGDSGPVVPSALWCNWEQTTAPPPASASVASVIRQHRYCSVGIVASGKDGESKPAQLMRHKQFRRLQGSRADLKDLIPAGDICLQDPAPDCRHGVEVGQVGPGGQLVWYRQPGPLTIRVLRPNATDIPRGYFSGEPVSVEAGKTYSFEARQGVVRLLPAP